MSHLWPDAEDAPGSALPRRRRQRASATSGRARESKPTWRILVVLLRQVGLAVDPTRVVAPLVVHFPFWKPKSLPAVGVLAVGDGDGDAELGAEEHRRMEPGGVVCGPGKNRDHHGPDGERSPADATAERFVRVRAGSAAPAGTRRAADARRASSRGDHTRIPVQLPAPDSGDRESGTRGASSARLPNIVIVSDISSRSYSQMFGYNAAMPAAMSPAFSPAMRRPAKAMSTMVPVPIRHAMSCCSYALRRPTNAAPARVSGHAGGWGAKSRILPWSR